MVAHATTEIMISDAPPRGTARGPAGATATAINRSSVVAIRTVVDRRRRIVWPVIVGPIGSVIRTRPDINTNMRSIESKGDVTGLRRCGGREGHQRECTSGSKQRQVPNFHELTPSIRVLRYRDHNFVCKCEKLYAVNQTIPSTISHVPDLTLPERVRHFRNLRESLGNSTNDEPCR